MTDYGTAQQSYRREQISIGDKEVLVKIAVENGHREALDCRSSHRKSSIAKVRRVAKSLLNKSDLESVLTIPMHQQNWWVSFSGGSTGLSGSIGLCSPIGPVVNPFRGGAVGYSPVIRVLPQGAMMSTLGVILGDRRYVRVAQTPNFTDIVQIDTFNFITGSGSTAGGGLGGGGGGGGFGGGGAF